MLRIDWDPEKSDDNYARRGFDFVFAALVFANRYVEYEDARHAYGEKRVVALGIADGLPLTVVYTDRDSADGSVVRRIISARVSSRKERRHYAQEIKAATQDDAESGQS